ncbi:V-type ATPase subunit [Christensenellaceae bacterium OttesenSCG-928-M15]|nr:V-type ATPase subunit [Christensenellaceae bacterium OttesenSCG-928-M15]
MPQSSYIYAVARIRALETGLIGKDRMHRLSEGTLDDVVRMLVETGYGDMPEATADDCETMIARELTKANKLMQEVTPEQAVTDLFLMKADIHNLKVLLKARLLGNKEEPLLLEGGLYQTDLLVTAVRDRNYRSLPKALKEELNTLEKTLQVKENPQQISVALDRAYHLHAREVLKKHKNEFAGKYFNALADFDNVNALLRIRSMGGTKENLHEVLLPVGDVTHSAILSAFDQPFETMSKQLSTGAAGGAIALGFEEVQRTGQNSAMEKARDNHLMRLIKKGKYDMDSLQPVLGYYLAREQEAKCVRLIVTAKRNDLPEQVITERLREVYG